MISCFEVIPLSLAPTVKWDPSGISPIFWFLSALEYKALPDSLFLLCEQDDMSKRPIGHLR